MGLQVPETNETIFRLGAELVSYLLGAEFVRGRDAVELVISNKIRIRVDLKCNLSRSPTSKRLCVSCFAGRSLMAHFCVLTG